MRKRSLLSRCPTYNWTQRFMNTIVNNSIRQNEVGDKKARELIFTYLDKEGGAEGR